MLNAPEDVQLPDAVHPSFYGCYDWHSSVHGHWMLARILRLFPSLPEAPAIIAALNRTLTAEHLAVEAAYFMRPGTAAFERMYGWAWTLKLAEELHRSSSPDAERWEQHLQPLTTAFVKRYLDFLPKQMYAIRTGVHPNTAFGLGFALDYAVALGDAPLKDLVVARSRDYFLGDTDYPAKLEPNGSDFLSPALVEADLQDWLRATAAKWGVSIRELELVRGDVTPRAAAATVPARLMRVRLATDLKTVSMLGFLSELGQNERLVLVDRLVLRPAAQPALAELELRVLALAKPADKGAR